MAKQGHSEEEILRVLREAEAGKTVVEICRKYGVSQQSRRFPRTWLHRFQRRRDTCAWLTDERCAA